MPALPRRALLDLRKFVTDPGYAGPELQRRCEAALDAALRPSKASAFRTTKRKAKTAEKKTKDQETSAIRAAVFARAAGRCEGRWGDGRCEVAPDALDHFFGRGKVPQKVSNCWALCSLCHDNKTRGHPDGGFWLEAFAEHCSGHGYRGGEMKAAARLQFVSQRSAFGRAAR